jgi:hypothetical protein
VGHWRDGELKGSVLFFKKFDEVAVVVQFSSSTTSITRDAAETAGEEMNMPGNPRMDAIIAAKGMRHPDEVFKAAKSYADLKCVNIAFLQGKVHGTPHHLRPLDDETLPLVDDLVRINAHGFISISGQPASHGIDSCDDCGLGCRYEEWEQRPFLEGFMPRSDLDSFQSYMARFSGSYHYIVHEYDVSLSVIATFPGSRYNVTRMRAHADKTKLDQAPWKNVTNISTYDEFSKSEYDFYKFSPKLHKLLTKYTFIVTIAGTEYGQGSVEDLLLDFYENHKSSH